LNRAIGDGSLFYIGKMNKKTIEVQTWPLWMCISSGSLAKLVIFQWQVYGTKLDLLIDIEWESLQEIDRLIRDRPRYRAKVW